MLSDDEKEGVKRNNAHQTNTTKLFPFFFFLVVSFFRCFLFWVKFSDGKRPTVSNVARVVLLGNKTAHQQHPSSSSRSPTDTLPQTQGGRHTQTQGGTPDKHTDTDTQTQTQQTQTHTTNTRRARCCGQELKKPCQEEGGVVKSHPLTARREARTKALHHQWITVGYGSYNSVHSSQAPTPLCSP